MPDISHKILALYRGHEWLFSLVEAEWLSVFSVTFLLTLVWSQLMDYFSHMSLVGISEDEIAKARGRKKNSDGKPVALTFSEKANLDHPPKRIRLRRGYYRLLSQVTLCIGAVIFLTYGINLILLMAANDRVTLSLLFGAERLYPAAWLVGGLIAGMGVAKALHFFLLTDFLAEKDAEVNREVIASRSRHKGRTGELSDARSLHYSAVPDFDPLDYFNMAKSEQSVFLGLDEQRKPVLIPRRTWVKSNIQIMGSVGSGKGVLACGALAQCVRLFNDAVIVFDPKNDEFAPHVLRSQADKFLLLDLRQDKPAQLNIFRDLSSHQLNELLVSGFSLGRRGDNADFHRDNDRQAVRLLSSQFERGADVVSLLEAAQRLPQKVRESATGFMTLLQELCSLSVLQTREGVDLKDFILNGGCLYVIGSLRDESVIMLQKMLFVRCLQIIEERDRSQSTTHVNIFLDEFKYLLSKASLEALGTVRDKNCNILLTHQSLGDFGQVGADIRPETAQATVIDNTPVKWIYRMKDYSAAEWASKQTGQILVDSERRSVNTETGNVELMSTETTVYKEKRELIDTNTIQHLPDGAAVLIGAGLARLAYSKPIKTQRHPIALKDYPRLERPALVSPAESDSGSAQECNQPAKHAGSRDEVDSNGWR